MIKKSDSKWFSLTTVSILGQPPKQQFINHHYLLTLGFYLLILTGCVTKPAQHNLNNNVVIQANSFMQSGQHHQAATLYQTLAKSNPSQFNQYSLLAAEAYIRSANSHAAHYHAQAIDPATLSAEQRNRLNLLYAQIYLSSGEAELALNKLSITQPYKLNSTNQYIYYQSLAFSHSLTGNLLQSAQAQIQLGSLLNNDQQIHENNNTILRTLESLPAQTLSHKQPSPPDILGGWMALTNLLKSRQQNQKEFFKQINKWKQLFPNHPANSEFLQSYLTDVEFSYQQPSTLALLLPESGRFSNAAKVIKEGFMAAYHHSDSGHQPQIRFYDSSSASSHHLYQQAIVDGAELVIGPLHKDNIQSLVLNTELTIPVLALNHIPGLAKDKLFQFGLSPIDEAKQISSKAKQDNKQKVLILTPQTNKGNRTENYLTESWQETGGTILEAQSYKIKENDFSIPIKDLLNLNESRHRYNRLQSFLGTNIQYTERRRQDVDAIFLSASAKTARSLYPQLRFFRATRIPVYATPDIYSGKPNTSLDRDLNNIVFCDIPWLFSDAYQGELNQESLRNKWEQLPAKYLKLFALGIDSFNIINQLGQMDNTPYSGASGTLAIDSENRITRELVCTKFIKGKPVLLDKL